LLGEDCSVFLAIGACVVGPVALSQPTSQVLLSDKQIAETVNDTGLYLVRLKRQYVSCGWMPSTPPPRGPVGTSEQAPDGYSTWLAYVANHVRSGSPFDTEYADIAANIFSGGVVKRGEPCLQGPTKNLEQRQAIGQVDPMKVGLRLFSVFLSYDQNTRIRAAATILSY
jgi:hypothetical protein